MMIRILIERPDGFSKEVDVPYDEATASFKSSVFEMETPTTTIVFERTPRMVRSMWVFEQVRERMHPRR